MKTFLTLILSCCIAIAFTSCTKQTTEPVPAGFTPLAAPSPAEGFQVTTGKFDVAPHFEREIFVYRKTPITTASLINRIHFKMRPNSHHLVLYLFDPSTPTATLPKLDEFRDLRDSAGNYIQGTQNQMNYHQFLSGSMVQEDEYVFPDSVALYLPKSSAIDFNTHFINRTGDTFSGECYANIYYAPDPAKIKYLAQTLFLIQQNITLPPHKVTVVTYTEKNQTTTPWNVFMLTSHNHEWGEKFQIKIAGGLRNGEIVYESTDWSHPLIKRFDTPIILKKGEGLQSVVTYNNTTDRTISFGLTSQDEMSVVYGYYY